MAEAFTIISAAVGFALKLESMVHSLSEDLKNAKEFGSSLESARLVMQWEADRMKDMRILLFGLSDRDNIVSEATFGRFDYTKTIQRATCAQLPDYRRAIFCFRANSWHDTEPSTCI